jgi:uncharacterized protein YprB with RNaseH-like and TPR domain
MIAKSKVNEVLELKDNGFTRDIIAVQTGLTPEQVKHICSTRFQKARTDKIEPPRLKIFSPALPISRMKKQEIIWLHNHTCKHGHTYLEHYSCFAKEQPLNQRIGFLDIETSHLRADFGIMLCYCIKELGKKDIKSGIITKQELLTCLDEKVVGKCVEDLRGFDRIITFYGKRFDAPFLRTRAVVHDIDFPQYGLIIHDDMYFLVRSKFLLSSNRMENACRVLVGKTEKTKLNPTVWLRAMQGNQESFDYILEHCKNDVQDLERLYFKVRDYTRRQDTSI